MNRPPLLLASRSPRRTQLLREVGLAHRVRPANVDERARPGERPQAMVRRLALAKARAVAARAPNSWVIGADTLVVQGGEVIGKPSSPAAARRILRRLSGRTHQVLTGLALLIPNRRPLVTHASTDVRFRRLTGAEIAAYVASGEPLDKAGAYHLQGRGAAMVRALRGSFTNVVGMPLERLLDLLRRAGCDPVTGLSAGSRTRRRRHRAG